MRDGAIIYIHVGMWEWGDSGLLSSTLSTGAGIVRMIPDERVMNVVRGTTT